MSDETELSLMETEKPEAEQQKSDEEQECSIQDKAKVAFVRLAESYPTPDDEDDEDNESRLSGVLDFLESAYYILEIISHLSSMSLGVAVTCLFIPNMPKGLITFFILILFAAYIFSQKCVFIVFKQNRSTDYTVVNPGM